MEKEEQEEIQPHHLCQFYLYIYAECGNDQKFAGKIISFDKSKTTKAKAVGEAVKEVYEVDWKKQAVIKNIKVFD